MNEKSRYVIQTANNLSDDSIKVEIIYDNSLFAELSKEGGKIKITFYEVPPTSIDARVFLLALRDAIIDAESLPN